MWNRADLKKKAKTAVKRNYLACMLAALILLFTMGSQVTDKEELVQDASSTYYANLALEEGIQQNGNQEFQTDEEEDQSLYEQVVDLSRNPNFVFVKRVVMGPMQVIWDNIVWMLGSIAALVMLLLGIFVFNPVEVGGCRFFSENEIAFYGNLPKVRRLFFVFRDKNYRNVVVVMFLKNLSIMLWSLLLIIPGVIKAYEYRMVPYLLAENPAMNKKEAFEKSAEMMFGQKWNAFVLDLSFFLWDYLAIITFGLAGIFFVYPYEHATNAELYLCLKGEKGE